MKKQIYAKYCLAASLILSSSCRIRRSRSHNKPHPQQDGDPNTTPLHQYQHFWLQPLNQYSDNGNPNNASGPPPRGNHRGCRPLITHPPPFPNSTLSVQCQQMVTRTSTYKMECNSKLVSRHYSYTNSWYLRREDDAFVNILGTVNDRTSLGLDVRLGQRLIRP